MVSRAIVNNDKFFPKIISSCTLISYGENMVHSLNELSFIDHDKSNDDNKSCNKSEITRNVICPECKGNGCQNEKMLKIINIIKYHGKKQKNFQCVKV